MRRPKKPQNVRNVPRKAVLMDGLRKLLRVLKVGVIAALLVGTGYGIQQGYQWLLTTPRMALKTIDVRGVERLSVWEVQVLGELKPGTNLLTIDIGRVADQIGRHPWVEKVRVRRVLPDRLEIGLKERQPVALLAQGDLFYVDAAGHVFKKVSTGDSLNYPILTGFDKDSPLQTARVGKAAILEALELLRMVTRKTGFAADQISEIHVDPSTGYTVHAASSGAQIQLGWEQFDKKLDRLVKLLTQEQLDLAQVRHINLDLARWAVVTPL